MSTLKNDLTYNKTELTKVRTENIEMKLAQKNSKTRTSLTDATNRLQDAQAEVAKYQELLTISQRDMLDMETKKVKIEKDLKDMSIKRELSDTRLQEFKDQATE
jgi:hypothetical protein